MSSRWLSGGLLLALGACHSQILHQPAPARVQGESTPFADEKRLDHPTNGVADSARSLDWRSERGDMVLATIGGQEIRSSDLGRSYLTMRRREAVAELSRLIAKHVAESEARRLGITFPAGESDAERGRARQAVIGEAAQNFGAGTAPERYAESVLGRSLEAELDARVAAAQDRWILSRVIRYHALTSERVEIAILVVDETAVAQEISGKLRAGADFERLATLYSRHPSRTQGGNLAPLAVSSLSEPVRRALAGMTDGEISPVLEVPGGQGTPIRELVKLRRRIPAQAGDYATLATAIEQDLIRRPVDVDEWQAWYLSLEAEFGLSLRI